MLGETFDSCKSRTAVLSDHFVVTNRTHFSIACFEVSVTKKDIETKQRK